MPITFQNKCAVKSDERKRMYERSNTVLVTVNFVETIPRPPFQIYRAKMMMTVKIGHDMAFTLYEFLSLGSNLMIFDYFCTDMN